MVAREEALVEVLEEALVVAWKALVVADMLLESAVFFLLLKWSYYAPFYLM